MGEAPEMIAAKLVRDAIGTTYSSEQQRMDGLEQAIAAAILAEREASALRERKATDAAYERAAEVAEETRLPMVSASAIRAHVALKIRRLKSPAKTETG